VPSSRELPRDIGIFIRDLRRNARISLRQLAEQAGVSNPYLSQIERGLRRPSAEVLAQLASALRISTPLMYLRAGLLDSRDGHEVLPAIAADPDLNVAQKQSLTQIYETFRRENARAAAEADGGNGAPAPVSEAPVNEAPAGAEKAPAGADEAPSGVDQTAPDVTTAKPHASRKRTAAKATAARNARVAQSPNEE
jgi:transcriptional regulator with XRE-family HTH domain